MKNKEKKKENKKAKKIVRISAGVLAVIIVLLSVIPATAPYMRVVPDTAMMGIDYIDFSSKGEKIPVKEMKEKIITARQDISHPFVFADNEDFERVRNNYSSPEGDEYIKTVFEYTLSRADDLLTQENVEYYFDGDDGILEVSRAILSRVITLCTVYRVTGEEKYAEKAFSELEKACGYEDWNPSHFLDVAEMALAMSVGYDWLYDYLDNDRKQLIADNVYEKAIVPAIEGNILSQNWWKWSKVNWNTVCYGGIGIACMVFGEAFEEDAADILSSAYRMMPLTFELFNPDGVYVEGTGYWEYCTTYLVYFLSSSRNFFGTDFGLSDVPGVDKVGYYPVYVTGSQGVFNYGDNKPEPLFSPSLHWFADEYDAPLLSQFQKKADMKNNEDREAALSLIWYNTDFSGSKADFSDEPLAMLYKSGGYEDIVVMRSAYLDENATYAAIKSGYNYTNHGDLDIGSFVFDALGERWAEELGPGDYNAPNYFVGLAGFGRWQIYRKRAEGQNTLVINPDMATEDQYALASVEISSFKTTEDGGVAVIDMTEAYGLCGAKSVVREFELFDDYSSLRITDTVSCRIKSEMYWFMHTKADISVSEDGKSAVLSIGDKQMKATLVDCDGRFSVMEAEPLEENEKYSQYNKENEGIRKLCVYVDDFKDAKICVELTPVV